MSTTPTPPGGWSSSHFMAVCADVSSWTWGTVQGAFNEKASVTQIIVDAVVGMIPLVGDVTAARDLLAVIIGMANNEEKRHSNLQWMMLIVLLFALIPVFGGMVKGTGRLVIKLTEEAAHLAGPARAAHFAAGIKEIIEFLNRIGMRNAEKWLSTLQISSHAETLIAKFTSLTQTLDTILTKTRARIVGISPSFAQRIESLRKSVKEVVDKGNKMIPIAIKELDQRLLEIQAYVRSGGETTSRLALHEVATGQKVTTRADERRLVEEGALPTRNRKGGFNQNPASPTKLNEISAIYKSQPDYPNLMHSVDPSTNEYSSVAAFAGRMVNRPLKDGEEIYRFFGPPRTTHGVTVDEAWAGGAWWGLGTPPRNAKEWREVAAVLDSFNGDGFYVTAKIVGNNGPKAIVGTISEQFGERIPGQYLPGGGTQAFFFLEKALTDTLKDAGHEFIKGSMTNKIFDAGSGIEFTLHKTNWTDSNGIWGYIHAPNITSIQTAKIGIREEVNKTNEQVTFQP